MCVQAIIGALVNGPDTTDHFIDARTNSRGTRVAIDNNTGLLALLAAVLQLGEDFWHGGNLTRIDSMCHDALFRGYRWSTVASGSV
jgi:hypothetical protein